MHLTAGHLAQLLTDSINAGQLDGDAYVEIYEEPDEDVRHVPTITVIGAKPVVTAMYQADDGRNAVTICCMPAGHVPEFVMG